MTGPLRRAFAKATAPTATEAKALIADLEWFAREADAIAKLYDPVVDKLREVPGWGGHPRNLIHNALVGIHYRDPKIEADLNHFYDIAVEVERNGQAYRESAASLRAAQQWYRLAAAQARKHIQALRMGG